MFFLSTLRDWLFRRRRDVFTYWDGSKWRRGDPIRIGTKLDEVCPTYIELLRDVVHDVSKDPVGPFRDEAVKAKGTAARMLATAALKVFDLKPLTDTDGLTDGEALGVLTEFFVFMEGVAAEAKVFTTSSSPTASSPTA